jgi:hypothetical protein
MTVQTVPIPVRFNTTCLTDTVTNLPIVAHTLAPSLLDYGNVESHPGPVNTPMGQWVDKNEEHIRIATEFNLSNGEIQYTLYKREFSVSDDDRREEESDYAVDYMTDLRLTEHIIVDLLTHMDTAENDALKAEQASRGRAVKTLCSGSPTHQ